ncbi:hypothetical protein Tco_0314400, partial [Tanacetum coccineum]
AVDCDEGDEIMVRWHLWRRWSLWWQRRGGDGGATVVNMAEVMVDVVWRWCDDVIDGGVWLGWSGVVVAAAVGLPDFGRSTGGGAGN